ncbi:MAG: sigma-54 dependent transcriptional regulator [Bacteroidota bacterium]
MTIQQVKQRYGIIGNCRAINTAVEVAMQVAPTEVTVLVTGENGTGKDVFSRIIHGFSKRKHERFMAINCGAIPEGTLDSELFGHEKGSFTSAYESRKGYFEEVENGTLFLDEIAEMPMATQARLLRLLENGEYLRVGSSKVQRANVRIIAATNKNLVEMIRQGKFREDLYFRLNTVSIQVPALRERGDDIELLFRYFAMEFSDKYRRDPVVLSPDATPLLYKYRWPGNVRELRNLAEKLTVLVRGELVTAETLEQNLLIRERYLPSVVRLGDETGPHGEANQEEVDQLYKLIYDLGKEVAELKKAIYMGIQGRNEGQPVGNGEFAPSPTSYNPSFGNSAYFPPTSYEGQSYQEAEWVPESGNGGTHLLEESLSLEKKEREMIEKALLKHSGNRSKAAQALGISERTLYRKIKNYDISL